MKLRGRIAIVAAALSAVAPAWAERPPSRMLEGAIETYSNQITLPGSAGGSVTVSRCDGCKGRSLYINAGTKFFIGSKEVTLREMSTYLRSGQRQPTAIFYTLNDGNVRRVAAGK